MNAFLDDHWHSQVALGYSDGDEIGCVLDIVEWFRRHVWFMIARQAEEQVVRVFPDPGDNPFEYKIVDHDNLHRWAVKNKLTGTILQQEYPC